MSRSFGINRSKPKILGYGKTRSLKRQSLAHPAICQLRSVLAFTLDYALSWTRREILTDYVPAMAGILSPEATVTEGDRLAEDLLSKCHTLLRELEEFRNFVVKQELVQEPAVEIRKFRTSVATELKTLQKVYHPRLPSCDPAIDCLPACRVRSDCRENPSYAPLVQPTVLFCHMGICKGDRKPGNVP